MNKLKLSDVTDYVEENVGVFHQNRITRLKKLKLKEILKRKNPYLFKAKDLSTAGEIIPRLADAYLSSSEETIFGDWLEGLAIFINGKVYNGRKGGIQGIDLEFDKDNIRYIVSIKSGPNWGNSSQIKKLRTDFNTAKRTLRTSNSRMNVIAVNGCCYGKASVQDKTDYFKICGQNFWEFISGNKDLYVDIIEPLGHKAKEKNEEFLLSYRRMINLFTKELILGFCKEDGEIDWDKLVRFNSQAKEPLPI